MACKNPIILIPSRLAATRLPQKPLADIGGVPMVVRAYRLAQKVGVRVVVAAGDGAIVDVVEAAGGEAVLTDPALPSGSDRIYAALTQLDAGEKHDAIINLQGDLPHFDPRIITQLIGVLPQADITTPVVAITDDDGADNDKSARTNPNIVKTVLAEDIAEGAHSRALYFSRALVPSGTGTIYAHVGIYAYHRAALANFVRLPAAAIEQRERLEQLRALAAGMHIAAVRVKEMPITVDTADDLAAARAALEDK